MMNNDMIFNLVLQISAVIAVNDKIIFNVVLQIRAVSVASDEIISNYSNKKRKDSLEKWTVFS